MFWLTCINVFLTIQKKYKIVNKSVKDLYTVRKILINAAILYKKEEINRNQTVKVSVYFVVSLMRKY